MAKPVFYDPRQARWKRLRRLFDVLGVIVIFLTCFFAYQALRDDQLPELILPAQKKAFHSLKENERAKAREKRLLALRRSHRKSNKSPSQVQLNTEEGIRAAFYVSWDAASFSSLREHAHQIDLLYPEWLHVLSGDGRLQGVDPQTNKFFDVVQDGTVHPVDDKVMPFLKTEDTGMEVFPLVNNFDGTDWVDITSFLNNPDARARFRKEVSAFLSTDNYRGLMMDFESFPQAGQRGYLALLNELSAELHAQGKNLYVSVPSHNDEWNYPAVAAAADGVVLMNYDEHYPGGNPGPVASQEWFVENLKFAKQVIPRQKLICAVANFGYDWPNKPKRGRLPQDEKDKNQTVQDAWLAARDSDAEVVFDGDALNPHVTYLDERDIRHDVWFLDAVTALNQMRAAQLLGIKTFALWRLGAEDRSLWRVWDIPGEPGAPDKLKDVPPGQDVDMEGAGEILQVEAKPANGRRSITVNPSTGIIEDQDFDELPEPYRVARYGASPNRVALTFDDGPDPQWTPKILDVLKAKQAPATFFVIGIQGAKFSGLLERINRENHEIGNHTFTHPDISDLSQRFAKVELNLTEQLFASHMGIRTVLFRPPYSIDQEPDTEDQVRPLETTQAMGYITVGDKLDPNDWREIPHRSAEEISADVLSHLPPCAQYDQKCGNVILLHDGGGNRSETVRALPMIIDGVRARGFQIVSVHELLGKTRDDVMPPIPANQRWRAALTLVGYWMLPITILGITWIFFAGDILMTGRLLIIGAFAIFDRFRTRAADFPENAQSYGPKVAVLIPAYNEEKVIRRTIKAALSSTYPNLRVIVIDDGSSDATLTVARQAFPDEQQSGKVTILTKKNSGKADALNYGLEQLTDEEIFVGIDADTVIAPDAIARLVPHFVNPKVGAVAGNAKVGNRVNVWTRWQALEYITSQNFERRALNTLGAVSVVPGAIGAWRISAVREAGGYHTDTVAEDADLTMALLRNGYRVEYEDLALAYTEAPINANGLMRQRFRWSFGILQSVWKHRGVFARKGVLGLVALPNIVVFQILLPLVSPLIDLMFAGGTIWYYLNKLWWHPESTDPASFHRLVLFFVAFLIIDFVASAIAFMLERRQAGSGEEGWLLTQVWLQRFAYRQLFSIVLFKTLKRAVQGKPFAWDKLERTAALSFSPHAKEETVASR